MNIPRGQQLSLIKEIKSLIDENRNNTKVLERVYPLAIVVYGILYIDGDIDSLGFSLQEYAYENLEIARGDSDAGVWIDVNNKRLNEAIDLNEGMKLSCDEQTKFAREILALEARTTSLEPLLHLNKLVTLLNFCTNLNNNIIVDLNEYILEVVAIKSGEKDTGWKDKFKKKLDTGMSKCDEIMRSNSKAISLSQKYQNESAREIIAIVDMYERDSDVLGHLCKLTSLLVQWTKGSNADTLIDLSEYVGTLNDIAHGSEDNGWADDFKKALYYDIGYEDRLEK